MKNNNFFQPFIDEDKQKKKLKIYVTLVIMVLFLSMGTTYYYQIQKIQSLTSDINDIEKELAANNKGQSIYKSAELQEEKKLYGVYNNYISEVNQYLAHKKVLYNEVIKELTLCLPENISYDNLLIEKSKITLLCNSSERESIAKYATSLNNNKKFSKVAIGNITFVEGPLDGAIDDNYYFNLVIEINELEVGEND